MGKYFLYTYRYIYIYVYILQNLECQDKIPLSCELNNSPNCSQLAKNGLCEETWVSSGYCGNITGKIKETCKTVCNNCGGM